MVAIRNNFENPIFALSPNIKTDVLVIAMKHGRDIARVRTTLAGNMTSNNYDLGNWQPFEVFSTNKPQNNVKLFFMVSNEFF